MPNVLGSCVCTRYLYRLCFNVYQLGYKALQLVLCHSSLPSSLKESIMSNCLSNMYFPGIAWRETKLDFTLHSPWEPP